MSDLPPARDGRSSALHQGDARAVRIIHGDAVETLKGLAAASVHLCVTSPPYWGLRAYAGVEPSVWGGSPSCAHDWGTPAGRPGSEYRDGQGANSTFVGREDKEEIRTSFRRDRAECATRKVRTPEQFFAATTLNTGRIGLGAMVSCESAEKASGGQT